MKELNEVKEFTDRVKNEFLEHHPEELPQSYAYALGHLEYYFATLIKDSLEARRFFNMYMRKPET